MLFFTKRKGTKYWIIKSLRYFIEVYNSGNMTKAAQNMFVSQQALSNSLNNLEKELGVILFTRRAKGLHPTEAGIFLKEIGEPVLQKFDNMVEMFHSYYSANVGELHLLIAPTVMRVFSYDTIMGIQNRYTDVNMKITERSDAQCIDMIKDGRAHLALCPRPLDLGGLEFIYLKTEPLYAILNPAHAFAHRDLISLNDLRNEKFLLLDNDSHILHRFMKSAQATGFSPNIVLKASDRWGLVKISKHTDYVFVDESTIAEDALKSGCSIIQFAEPEMVCTFGILYKSDKKISRLEKNFIAYMKQMT